MHQSDPDTDPTPLMIARAAAIAAHDHVELRTPGFIQPHGVLLAFAWPTLHIQQVSANVSQLLAGEPTDFLEQSLMTVLPPASVTALQTALLEEWDTVQLLSLQVQTRTGLQAVHAWVHRRQALGVLELEPVRPEPSPSPPWPLDGGQRAIAKLNQESDLIPFLQLAASEIRTLTDFDRVMVYQFDTQRNGTVIAEVKPDDATSYLHLRFPAIDIPQAAQDLYLDCPLRYIPDLQADPVPLIGPPTSPPDWSPDPPSSPIDLGRAVLRSVAPCCITYHQNMGTQALLVLSLVVKGQLWGLIACHHPTPHRLRAEQRVTCALLRQVIALTLANKVSREVGDYQIQIQARHNRIITRLAQADDFQAQLINPDLQLAQLVEASGVAICLDDNLTLVGHTPPPHAVRDLLDWVVPQIQDHRFWTDRLPHHYPPAQDFQALASGILLMQISPRQRYFILWFRPEVLQTIDWAGAPAASIQEQDDGSVQLSPRTSFALWQETVRGQSLPWKPSELTCVTNLRQTIVNLILNKADELAQLNRELVRSNQELSTFAYAASHDLKEPLRGIHNYSLFLLEDYETVLDEAGAERLQTLVRLTQRMEALIDVLLKFSRLGQADLKRQSIDLNRLLERVTEVYLASRPDQDLDIRVPRPLPQVNGDPVLLGEVLSNLISNGFKYNTADQKWVEIGYLDINQQLEQGIVYKDRQASGTTVLYVRDNGIGIRKQHLETIFQLFKRLHARHKYGGGAGAGLTIAKKIVERHQGRLWVKSTHGKGTTFYFSLGEQSLRKP